MIIRTEQLQSLSAASLENFKTRLVAHIREWFPHQYAVLGDPLTRLLVDLGVESARDRGIEGKRDICGFIDLMLIFGPDFDKDPDLPWARAILDDTNIPSTEKMPRLLETANAVLERIGNAGGTRRGADNGG